MHIGLVPQWPAALERSLEEFSGGEYDPRKQGGPDREFWYRLKSSMESDGHNFNVISEIDPAEADVIIFVGFRYGNRYYREAISGSDRPRLLYIAREPPLLSIHHSYRHLIKLRLYFDKILTWNDDLTTMDRFEKYHIPIPDEHFHGSGIDQNSFEFNRLQLLTMVNTNNHRSNPNELYSERRSVIEFYEENHPECFNLYGQSWNRSVSLNDILQGKWVTSYYETYRGEIDNKLDAITNHKFALCFENRTGINGYITEKVFDAFAANRVPVYWGANNIFEYLPQSTVVDYRDFGEPSRLHSHLTNMGEEEYLRKLDRISEFMARQSADFRMENVVQAVKRDIYDVFESERVELSENLTYLSEIDEYFENIYQRPSFSGLAAEISKALIQPPSEMTRTKILRITAEVGLRNVLRLGNRTLVK